MPQEKTYIIQDDEKLFNKAIQEVQYGMNIIYSNCICHIKIDNITLKTNKYDTFLYNENTNTTIILLRDGKINKNDLIGAIPEESINEIIFTELSPRTIEKNNIPQILFCDDEKMLEENIKYAINKGKERCRYYTDIPFLLQLSYINRRGYPMTLIERKSNNLVVFEDILLFISEHYEKDNRYFQEVSIKEKIEKYGIKLKVIENKNYKNKKRARTLT